MAGFGKVGSATSVLVKVADSRAAGLEAQMRLGFGAGEAETILTVPPAPSGNFGMAGEAMRWLRVDAGGNAWDRAHALADASIGGNGFGMAGGVAGAEPDIVQQWLSPQPKAAMALDDVDPCAELPQNAAGGRALGDGFAWHLRPEFGGLAAARAAVGAAAQQRVRIAHLDTGYDPAHTMLPRGLRRDLQRNFVPGNAKPDSAEDQVPAGANTKTHSRGHGTGTIGILAGGNAGTRPGFSDGLGGDLGGAPDAQVIPIRVADFVAIFSTSTIVQGINHAIANGCDVLSMSLGGLASAALADAVNLAYDAGLVLVTAAGNTIAGAPTPKSIVYPARMARVLAATGVMADGRSYSGLDLGTMEGCFGPASKMATALAGWTPNIPWARIGCGSALRLNGEGTSAATPQVAATAALWIAQHYDALAALPERWMRIEAVRNALFKSARRVTTSLDAGGVLEFLGQGAVRADEALKIGVGTAADYRRLPPASASWDWLKMIFGGGMGFDAASKSTTEAMLGLELQQLAFLDPDCIAALAAADTEAPTGVDAAARKHFLEAAHASPLASNTLKTALEETLATGRDAGTTPASPPPPVAPDTTGDGAPPPAIVAVPQRPQWRAPRREPLPAARRLRVFALDPALANDFATVRLSTTTITVPYEDDLRPGPVGEYIEVVDVDPASNRVYAPVDLGSRQLLAKDGLTPSEGNPQFHQQMAYAIAMKTIVAFESALGRRSLWAKYRDRAGKKPRDHFVPRLRLYPHALRARNAYYSPDKIAILFGYFNATTARGAAVVDNSMVFSTLSADIVAHEVTHALLDGLHRRYQENSNPDVGAFHEAFADIVALFQHFTFEELVASAISGSHADLSARSLLSGLAQQFGLATGKDGALRDYLDPDKDGLASYDYQTEFEVHRRGSILVLCIWKAFLAIVTRRNQDLIKLATGGSGLLPEGELHPLLVARLAHETAKAADQIQRMCIRALDYCPPADITFGEYLRAIMTADLDHVPDDKLGYRTAMLQAFRSAGVLPEGLRTVSVESLVWRETGDIRPFEPAENDRDWVGEAVDQLRIEWGASPDRETIYRGAERRRWVFRTHLLRAFAEGLAVPELFGLQRGLQLYNADFTPKPPDPQVPTNFEVHNVRRIRRARPDGGIAMHIVVVIAQRRPERLDPNDKQSPQFWFRGGCTVIIDPVFTESSTGNSTGGRIRYIISKPMGDRERLKKQREFLGGTTPGTNALYFGALAAREPFAFLHSDHDDDEGEVV